MALTPPSPLRHGAPLSALVPWTQRIVAYLRAITPRPSATVSVSTTPNGTLLSAAPSQTLRATSASSSPWAFEASATPEKQTESEGQDDDPPPVNYAVHIRGGTAQAVGGGTAVFPDHDFEHINDGEFFYIRFLLWDNAFEPTCYWYDDTTGAECTIEHSQALPVPSDNTRFITLVLCKVDSSAPGAIVQYRAGAIDIDATLAAGVAGSGITVRRISTTATPLEPEAPPSSGPT